MDVVDLTTCVTNHTLRVVVPLELTHRLERALNESALYRTSFQF